MDLAEAHGMALDHLWERQRPDPLTLNIGTGRGLSVLEWCVDSSKPQD